MVKVKAQARYRLKNELREQYVVNSGVARYDLAPASVRVTDFRGGPADRSGREVVSSNALVHDALLAQLVF